MNVPWSSGELARLKSEIIARGGTIDEAVARAQAVRRGTSRSSLDRICKVHLGKTLARALLDAEVATTAKRETASWPDADAAYEAALRSRPSAASPVVVLETPRPPPPEVDIDVPVDFDEPEEPTAELPAALHPHDEIQDEPGGYVPRPLRGPATKPHYVPDGHELGGVSRLSDAAGQTLQEWSKTRVAGADKPPVAIPASFLLDRASVMKRGDGSTVVEWASYKHDAVERWESIKEAIVEHIATYVRPAEPIVAPTMTDDDRITLYPIGDPHIGMLAWAEEVGENFDLGMAERELCECLRQLVARSPATSEAIVANLGDFWHAENDQQRTQRSGNKLDVDGRAGKVARVGLRILRTIIDTALTKHAKVRVRSIPGNHDLSTALWATLIAALNDGIDALVKEIESLGATPMGASQLAVSTDFAAKLSLVHNAQHSAHLVHAP